jgi:hypothetical protein
MRDNVLVFHGSCRASRIGLRMAHFGPYFFGL